MRYQETIYHILIQIVWPFYAFYLSLNSHKSRDHQDYYNQRLGWYSQKNHANTLMVVTEGLGEYRSISTLVAAVEQRFPEHKVMIALTDIAAYNYAKKTMPSEQLCYLPFDARTCVERFYQHFNPQIMVIIERALWPNLYNLATQRKIPCILLSGRISQRSLSRYQYAKQFFQKTYANLACISMQDRVNTQRLLSLGIPEHCFSIEGNLKYTTNTISDTEYTKMRQRRSQWLTSNTDLKIILGASTHAPEENLLMRCVSQLKQSYPSEDIRLILVPRDITRVDEIQRSARNSTLSCIKESQQPESVTETVFIVDSFGKMLDYLALADCAYIGGSWINHGGHNPLEAISMRTRVLTGPYNSNFTENWTTIHNHKLGEQVASEAELTQKLYRYLCLAKEAKDQDNFKTLLASHRNIITNYVGLISSHLRCATDSR